MWEVKLARKVEKTLPGLPRSIRDAFSTLLLDIEQHGPVRGNWDNYGKLGKNRHHCHVKKGRPTMLPSGWSMRMVCGLWRWNMLEHTNAPHTETVRLAFDVPPALVDTVLETMRGYGLREKNESVPWREALNVRDEDLPATCLRGGRAKEGLTQKRLSEMTGIPRCHISAMENGKRPIGKKTARILAAALNLDARLFLSA
jgi:DNA-binding XRE family transcriptional regulator